MSAAEKLKALEAAMAGRTEVTLEGQVRVGVEARSTFMDALPQIVAVVEAAEAYRVHEEDEPDLGDKHIEWESLLYKKQHTLDAALAALDSALRDVT